MGRTHDVAIPPGVDPAQLTRFLYRARDEFVSSGRTDPSLRPVVRDSWLRSLDGGMNPESSLATIRLDEDDLGEIRAAHPLATGMPIIRRLLVDSAAEAGLIVAVSDAAGQLLWVEGSHSLRSRAEGMHFLPGADWTEASAGTNAPGTALALDRAVQIFGPEHLGRPVTPWSCSAAPIHDPDTGAVLGVLDVTGGAEVATAHSLALIRATVAAVEAELRIERLTQRPASTFTTGDWSTPTLAVLGGHGAVLSYGVTTSRLSLRHSELLLMIALAPDGLTSAEIAIGLRDGDQSQVTIRAEVSRLRSVLGPLELASRPYRLRHAVRTDVAQVRDHLAAGRLRQAVGIYRGPVLPASSAPAIVQLRDTLHMQVRSTLLAGTDADALLSFADTAHGRDDFEIWERALHVLPITSPRYAQVAAHVERLEDEQG